VEVLTDHARERVEIRSTRVVSEPIPSLSDSTRARPRECLQIRKPLQESRIVFGHSTHLRLLQHELGDEHAVRIAGAAPREVTRGAGPPGEELARKRRPHPLSPSPQCGEGGRARRFFRAWVRLGGRRTAHGYPRYSP